jgi:hypothetical protein
MSVIINSSSKSFPGAFIGRYLPSNAQTPAVHGGKAFPNAPFQFPNTPWLMGYVQKKSSPFL